MWKLYRNFKCWLQNLHQTLKTGKLQNHYNYILYEELVGFCKGRSCTDGYFSLKLLMEKHWSFNIETHISFINVIKPFDNVNQNKFFEIKLEDVIPNQIIYIANIVSVKTGSSLSDR